MSPFRRIAVAIAVLAVPAIAAAQPIAYPSFPPVTDFSAVARWLQAQTDVPPPALLVVRDGFAFSLEPGPPEQGMRALRLEVLQTDVWRALGGRSAQVQLSLDCNPVKATPVWWRLHAGSNLLGESWSGLDPARLPVSAQTWAILAGTLCDPAVYDRALTIGARLAPPLDLGPPPGAAGLPEGEFVVQVGAFLTPDSAVRALQAAARAAPEAMARRMARVEPFDDGGRLLYRALVTGFAAESEARAFCDLVGKHDGVCLPRALRQAAR